MRNLNLANWVYGVVLIMILALGACATAPPPATQEAAQPREPAPALTREKNITYIAAFKDYKRLVKDKGAKFLVVYFSDKTCTYCDTFDKIFKEVASSLSDVPFVVFETYYDPSVLFELDVDGTPTIQIFKNGKERSKILGTISKKNLLKHIKAAHDT
ncbi:MAG: thioredoxin family protein [Deltaproteobacteria bacterium]|nr:thioredoxin family protein [Deltaproteobacteria bacterium]